MPNATIKLKATYSTLHILDNDVTC